MRILFYKKQCIQISLLFMGIIVLVLMRYISNYCYNPYSVKKTHGKYDRSEPLIFIGGMPRSGTTLARALLDAHPDVRCGEETRVVPRLLQMRSHWKKSKKESMRLLEAGIDDEVLDDAISSFILDIIVKHGESAKRLCNKDPFTLKSSEYLNVLFPNAKFIFMIRDGRATVHSIITRKITITGFDLTSYRQCLQRWNKAMETMVHQCDQLGSDICLRVYYEQLVLNPKAWMKKILNFLSIEWDDAVLHHDQLINKPGGISLSKVERSTDQVIKPVNLEALKKWVGHIPDDVLEDMEEIAPMLKNLGYDPNDNNPSYGVPDAFVTNNTRRIQLNKRLYENKAEEVRGLRNVKS